MFIFSTRKCRKYYVLLFIMQTLACNSLLVMIMYKRPIFVYFSCMNISRIFFEYKADVLQCKSL